jgi:ubiquinone biosynthesis protein
MVYAAIVASAVLLREWLRLRGREGAAPRALGRALVSVCSRLGATFIKVGQIASTRGDLLPRPLVDELATLQDQVAPFPFTAVRDTIERALEEPLEAIFSSFDPIPVAAASVAQVHRAVLRANSAAVAVKVRRPEILDKVRLDRSILLFVARLLERAVPSLRLISLEAALRNFCVAVEQQTDLQQEAANNQRFAQNFNDDADIHFPCLYLDACADSVLTMEFIDGVREADLEARGVDVRRVVAAGLRCVCRMIFLHGFVHADLHPGNLRFFPPGQVVLLDLGLVASLVDEDRRSIAQLFYAFATGDGPTVAHLFYTHASERRTLDYAAYEREMVAAVDHVQRLGLANLQVTLEIGRIFDILRRHHIQARSHMTMVNLALMTAEGLGKRLAPDLSLTEAALPYLAEAIAGADDV